MRNDALYLVVLLVLLDPTLFHFSLPPFSFNDALMGMNGDSLSLSLFWE